MWVCSCERMPSCEDGDGDDDGGEDSLATLGERAAHLTDLLRVLV